MVRHEPELDKGAVIPQNTPHNTNNRLVRIEPAWKMHSFYRQLAAHPPQGYEFLTPESAQGKIYTKASKTNLSYSLLNVIDKIVPVNLAKAYAERLRRSRSDTALTYSYDHLIFRKEPWVVDLEFVTHLVGYNPRLFKRYKRVVQKKLASPYCRKIICGTEAARRTVTQNLDCTEFEHKLETVPFAIRRKEFTKQFTGSKVKLLFIGSANIVGQFETKGGREALEAFVLLNKKYDNLEFVVRSDVPKDVKEKYQGCANIRIIDEMIPWEILEREFQSADIFLLPVHNTPFSALLDAMSYELPIVTIDAWANSEVVADGKTGLLARKSEKVPYFAGALPNFGSPEFRKAIKTCDSIVVQGLVEKTSTLIENEDLRRQMGKAGRWEVEHGRFSIESRKERLKSIFDEATA